MTSFRYAPYAGRKAPFTIGLEPLDPADWIVPDENLPRSLAEKSSLLASRHSDVFRAHADTMEMQEEVLDLLADYLPQRHPGIYRAGADGMAIAGVGEPVGLAAGDRPPLETAARLVQDDLVIMRPGPDGYELAAAAVCFPSSWSLSEKFGLPLEAIHRPVPGYDGRMARRLNLIFDRLPADRIVWRSNWSIYDSDRLPVFTLAEETPHFGEEAEFDDAFLRVERQTLRRLPKSGALLFTIMITIDPLKRLAGEPDRKRLAEGLRGQLLGLSEEQLAYKSLAGRRDQLVRYLDDMIDGP